MDTPTLPEETLELPRSQQTAVDPWADLPEPPRAQRREVVPVVWRAVPPPAPSEPRPARTARAPREPRPPREPRNRRRPRKAPQPAPAVPQQGFPLPAPQQQPVAWASPPAPWGLRPLPRRRLPAAYALWLLLGAVGAHRFYLDRPISGTLYLLMLVLSPFTLFLSLPVLAVCLFVDLFTIPGMALRANRRRGWWA